MLRKIFVHTFLTTLLLVAGISSLHADEVILTPGYLVGQVSLGGNYAITGFSINASGGGYTANKYISNIPNISNYTLTTQGGPWENKITASLTASGGNGGSAYFYIADRTIQVPKGASVVNDYVYAPAIVRFEVTISGEPYNNWSASSRAKTPITPGQEMNSTSMNSLQFSNDNAWEMPVFPGQQIPLTATISIDGLNYNDYKTYAFDFGTRDLAPGEKVTIPIHIDYVAPLGNVLPPPPLNPNYYAGYLKGKVGLKNVPDNEIWSQLVSFQQGGSFYGYYLNPMDYSIQLLSTNPNQIFTRTPMVRTNLIVNGNTYGASSFIHPYTNNSPKDTVQIHVGETTYKDIITETGVLTGKINILGALPSVRINSGGIVFSGDSPQTANGLGTYPLLLNPEYNFKAYLSEGNWTIKSVGLTSRASSYNYSGTAISFLDKNEASKELGFTYIPYILPLSESVMQDMTLCIGNVTYNFRDVSGNPLTSSIITGTGTRKINSRTVLSMNVQSRKYNNSEQPEKLEIFGPTGNYELMSRVITADGSQITYPLMTKELSCGVQEVIDIPGPTMQVLSPQAALVTGAATVTVNGVVSGLSTIQSVQVNGQPAILSPSGNPLNSSEQQFSAAITLQPGVNTLVTTTLDASGASAQDTRIVYADLWTPTVEITTPATGERILANDSMMVTIDAADQGYGSTLTLYLDGEAIYQVNEPGSDSAPLTHSYTRTIAPLAIGEHQLKAEVIDAAGNSASTTSTVISVSDNKPPVITLLGDPALTIEAGFTYVDAGATALDDRDGNITTSIVITNPVDRLKTGSYTLRYNVTNSAGIAASEVERQVTVVDTTPPVLTVPVDLSIEATGVLSSVIIGQATATDIFAVNLTNNAPATYPLGSTVVTWTATDANGNVASETQLINVQDTTAPLLVIPANQIIEATSAAGAEVSFVATVTDLVDPAPTFTCSTASGSTFPLGHTLVTCSVTDASGNSSSRSFTVNVQDTTAPQLIVPANLAVLLNTSTTDGAIQSFLNGATAADTVDTDVAISVTTPTLNNVGPQIVTFTAVDDFGNTTTKTATVFVQYGGGSEFEPPVSLLKPFKLGSTIPVKFGLCDANGAAVSTAVARLFLQQFSGEEPVGDPIEVTSTSAADTGNYFRLASDSTYIYNLYTSSLSSGTFQIQAILDDGTMRTIPLLLKP